MAKAGARNPKVAQFSIRLDDKINSRLEAVADAAGANKGTMAAMAVAAGLNLLEQIYMAHTEVINRMAEEEASKLKVRAEQDMVRAAEVQEQAKRPFKLELERPERPRSEWSGYMSGL